MKFSTVLIYLLLPAALLSDSLIFKLPELKILQVENGKQVVYEFENSPNRFFLADSFLVANPKKYNYKVNINDINKLTVIRSKKIAPVMVLAFVIGGLLGAGLSGFGAHPTTPTTSEVIYAIVIVGGIFSLVAGGIAFLISHDREYILKKNMNTQKRKEILLEALEKNKEQ